ncbi:MAG: aminoacyl-tRNA hydrolase [Dehalococcoidales bacterium]
MKLIVGLGNPGQRYYHNRHNIGFMCLRYLARTSDIHLDKKQGDARIGRGDICGEDVILARPQTYMNLSGEPVRFLVRKFDIPLGDLIIVHDDLDLPLGKIRISQFSGSGGHRGVNSIIYSLGSQNFLRVRLGIGRPGAVNGLDHNGEDEIIGYVLSDFGAEEKGVVATMMPVVGEALNCILSEGVAQAMNRYN